MTSRLKICGITTAADARSCVSLGVDILGFNFYGQSPRFIPAENAYSIIDQIPLTVVTVGILIRPVLAEVLEILKTSRVSAVQIYEPKDFGDYSQIPVPVITAHRVSDRIPKNLSFTGSGMILIDSYSTNKMGGSGETFDWSIIPDTIPRERLILAGGINPYNISDALNRVNPAVIDVASGAEISPGKKDLYKVKQLVKAVRDYNAGKGK
jgi:phosphoribosylanthranilate isomerase